MSQNEERAKAISRIRKFQAQTVERGCTESQAMMAMNKIGELLAAFNLSMDEVSLASEECKEIRVSTGSTKKTPLSTTAVSVANFCDCVVYQSTDRPPPKRNKDGSVKRCGTTGRVLKERGDTKYVFYGITSDVEMAAYLFETIQAAMFSSEDEFRLTDGYLQYHSHKKEVSHAFREGYASRVNRRLAQLKDQLEEELDRARDARVEMGDATIEEINSEIAAKERVKGAGTDLVVAKKKKVEDDFKAKHGWGVKYTNVRSSARYNAGSRAGSAAGDRVNLSRPVGGGGYSGQLKIGN